MKKSPGTTGQQAAGQTINHVAGKSMRLENGFQDDQIFK
jgi:hypothetical protein